MANYDQLKQYFDEGKTDKEIAEIPGLNDTPRKVPLWELQEVLLASGAWVILDAVSQGDSAGAPLAKIIMGLFTGKLEAFDAVKYQELGYQSLTLMQATGVADAAIAAVGALIGLGNPNPTVEEIAAIRAEGEWNAARLVVERALDARYAALTESYNAAKNALGALNVGDEIPTVESLWA